MSAMVLSHRLPYARQVTIPVAVARVLAQLDQCNCSAIMPRSAQVSTMLLGRTSAAPSPQTATAGRTDDDAAAVAARLSAADAGDAVETATNAAVSTAPAGTHAAAMIRFLIPDARPNWYLFRFMLIHLSSGWGCKVPAGRAGPLARSVGEERASSNGAGKTLRLVFQSVLDGLVPLAMPSPVSRCPALPGV
jgi:hypothetical protein